MPPSWLTNYWSEMGKFVLPFIKYRKLGIEQVFGKKIIFRQHKQNKDWIYLKNQSEINSWAHKHLYSLHARQLSDKKELLFAIDIDKRNDKMPFDLVVKATQQMAQILDNRKQKYLLKYSGNRGFHFIWSMGKISTKDLKSDKIYQKEHQMIDKYTKHLEESIRADLSLNNLFNKYYPKDSPYFSTNSVDKDFAHCILIDKNILKKNALIRTPWSIHPKTGLVSAPIEVKDLTEFDTDNFTPTSILKNISLLKK